MAYDNKQLYIDIMLTYQCKKACDYCYLGKLRSDKTQVSPELVDERLKELYEHGYHSDNIEIYGGDMGLLSLEYVSSIMDICHKYSTYVTAIGNPWKINDLEHYKNVISLNRGRTDYYNNITKICENDRLDMITVALPDVLEEEPDYFLSRYQGSKGKLFIIPFFKSIYNDTYKLNTTNKQFCDFMIRVLDKYLDMNYTFELANITILESARDGFYNPFAEGSIYIMPNGKFARPKYTDAFEEYFCYYDSVEDWQKDTETERRETLDKCGTCEFYGKCIADHMRPFRDEDVCCGYLPLLQWWEDNRHRYSKRGQKIARPGT